MAKQSGLARALETIEAEIDLLVQMRQRLEALMSAPHKPEHKKRGRPKKAMPTPVGNVFVRNAADQSTLDAMNATMDAATLARTKAKS